VIPVVYSSFTSFYNPKKNLFTSGTKEPEGLYGHSEAGLMPYPRGELVHRVWEGSGAGVNGGHRSGRCVGSIQSTWHQSRGWLDSGENVLEQGEGCFQ